MEIRNQLLTLTQDCRPDMHEPDEQGVYGVVIGEGLDSASIPTIEGAIDIIDNPVENWRVNLTLVLMDEDDKVTGAFNIAELIAIIRESEF